MKALLSAYLFVALLSLVSSQGEPNVCWGCSGQDCSRKGKGLCRPGTKHKICYSKVTDFPMEGKKREETTYHKLGCMGRPNCHPVNYTASLPDGKYIHLEVKCCNKFFCNEPIGALNQKNRAINGMECPGCLARIPNANESCSSDATVRCRGQENKCISYTGGLQAPKFNYDPVSFKGCATKNLCDLLTGATEKGNDLLKPIDTVEAECSCAEFPA